MVVAGTMLAVSSLGSLIYLPILMMSLNGMRKVYTVLQQICVVGFLLTHLLNHTLHSKADYTYALKLNGYGADRFDPISLAEYFWRRLLAQLFQSFFLYTQYFLSFMQSLDVYQMICNPLFYAEFCSNNNVFKYLGVGLGISFALVLEDLIEVIAVCVVFTNPKELLAPGSQYVRYNNIANVVRKYSLVKFIVAKVIYSGIIITLAAKTKAALNQSEEMKQDKKKSQLYKNLFIFTLIPLGINFWYLFPELLDEIWPLTRPFNNARGRTFFLRKDTRAYIYATMTTIASFTYFVAFPLLFPKIKESIMCGFRKKAQIQ